MIMLIFITCSRDWYSQCNFLNCWLEPNDQGNVKSRALDQNKGNKTHNSIQIWNEHMWKLLRNSWIKEPVRSYSQFAREPKEDSRRLQIRNIEMNVQMEAKLVSSTVGRIVYVSIFIYVERGDLLSIDYQFLVLIILYNG